MRRVHRIVPCLTALVGCTPIDSSPNEPTAPTRPAPTSATSASAPVETPRHPPPTSTATPVAPTPVAPDPLAPLIDAVSSAVGGVDTVWSLGDATFILGRRGHPAHMRAAELRYPPRAAEAALGGRLVVFTEAWAWRAGHLARVLARPTLVRPMVCEVDVGCTIVELGAAVSPAGDVVLTPGTCADAIAASVDEKDASTFTSFDAAVIPPMCRAAGTYRWTGASFVPSVAQTGPVAPPTIHARDAVAGALAAAMAPGAIQARVDASWAGPSGDERLVALRFTYPAPSHGFFTHEAAARHWESGRAIDVIEVWLARDGSFRRVLQLPVGLGSLAEARVVVSLSVEARAGELVVCDEAHGAPPTRADPDPGTTALEREIARRDGDATRKILAGCGTYRFDGRALVRRTAPVRSSL